MNLKWSYDVPDVDGVYIFQNILGSFTVVVVRGEELLNSEGETVFKKRDLLNHPPTLRYARIPIEEDWNE